MAITALLSLTSPRLSRHPPTLQAPRSVSCSEYIRLLSNQQSQGRFRAPITEVEALSPQIASKRISSRALRSPFLAIPLLLLKRSYLFSCSRAKSRVSPKWSSNDVEAYFLRGVSDMFSTALRPFPRPHCTVHPAPASLVLSTLAARLLMFVDSRMTAEVCLCLVLCQGVVLLLGQLHIFTENILRGNGKKTSIVNIRTQYVRTCEHHMHRSLSTSHV